MKLPACIARRTSSFFNDRIKPEVLFIISMLCLPVFLLLPALRATWTAVAVFFVLTLLRRGKVRILPSVIIVAGIVFFSLLSPYGKLLLSVGGLDVTQGALESGLHKSGILIGMVFLSQFAVSPRLHFPGRIGSFLSGVFRTFNALTARRISLRPGSVISSIDSRLLEIWNDTACSSDTGCAQESAPAADGPARDE